MKQIAQNYKSGELAVLDVPAPSGRPGGVLVQSLFSLISTGTEMMKVTEANMSMVGMARARPDQVRKVLDAVSQQGVMTTYKKVMNRLDSYTPLGYSLGGRLDEPELAFADHGGDRGRHRGVIQGVREVVARGGRSHVSGHVHVEDQSLLDGALPLVHADHRPDRQIPDRNNVHPAHGTQARGTPVRHPSAAAHGTE